MDKYTLKTIFQKSFSGLIWRIEADTSHGTLAIESRDPGSGIPYFSVIGYADGQIYAFEQQYGDRSWTLAGINNGYVLLRVFGQQEPNGSGIACLCARTGVLLWEKFNYVFISLDEHAIRARPQHISGGYQTHLSYKDGNPLTDLPASEVRPLTPEIAIPEHVTAETAGIVLNHTIVGPIHHHRFGERDAWAFHTPQGDVFNVELRVTQQGKILESKIIISGLTKLLPEIFFAINRQLFFIDSNKQKIVSYLV